MINAIHAIFTSIMAVVDAIIYAIKMALVLIVSIAIRLLMFSAFRYLSVMFCDEISINGLLENDFEEY
jgi:hypothetical protein